MIGTLGYTLTTVSKRAVGVAARSADRLYPVLASIRVGARMLGLYWLAALTPSLERHKYKSK